MSHPEQLRRTGFTLVEMLVVIAIIGILVGLTIPAIQYARESARKTTCVSNLKTIAQATQQFLALHGHYPSGGWGSLWIGDPEGVSAKLNPSRPARKEQPGGLFYSILPHMERSGIYEMSKPPFPSGETKESMQLKMIQETLPGYVCPSRRRVRVYAVAAGHPAFANSDMPSVPSRSWFRTCYAVNGGTWDPTLDWGTGPTDAVAAKTTGAGFLVVDNNDPNYFRAANGIAHQCSKIAVKDIYDGASNTYLIGEKYINPEHYKDGLVDGDNDPAFGGDCHDLFCWGSAPPMGDERGTDNWQIFGGPHDGIFQVAMCDGAIRQVSFDIDLKPHSENANRRDSRP